MSNLLEARPKDHCFGDQGDHALGGDVDSGGGAHFILCISLVYVSHEMIIRLICACIHFC